MYVRACRVACFALLTMVLRSIYFIRYRASRLYLFSHQTVVGKPTRPDRLVSCPDITLLPLYRRLNAYYGAFPVMDSADNAYTSFLVAMLASLRQNQNNYHIGVVAQKIHHVRRQAVAATNSVMCALQVDLGAQLLQEAVLHQASFRLICDDPIRVKVIVLFLRHVTLTMGYQEHTDDPHVLGALGDILHVRVIVKKLEEPMHIQEEHMALLYRPGHYDVLWRLENASMLTHQEQENNP